MSMLTSFVRLHPSCDGPTPVQAPPAAPPSDGDLPSAAAAAAFAGSPSFCLPGLPQGVRLLPLTFTPSNVPSVFNLPLLGITDKVLGWCHYTLSNGEQPAVKHDDTLMVLRHKFKPALVPDGWPVLKAVTPRDGRNLFTTAEDGLLFLGLYKHGDREWAPIAGDLMPARDPVKLAHRFKNRMQVSDKLGAVDNLFAAFRVLSQLVRSLCLQRTLAPALSVCFLPPRPGVICAGAV